MHKQTPDSPIALDRFGSVSRWTNAKDKLGQVTIAKPGPARLTLKPESFQAGAGPSLTSVKLVPVK
jgi:hypothetical protein